MHGNFKDLSGEVFGSWTVLRKAESKGGRICFLCKCKCGNKSNIYSCNLTTGKSTGCTSCRMRNEGNSSLEAYIIRNTKICDGCIEWTGCLAESGYGIFTFKQKNYFSHRASYEVYKGKIPKGKLIRHLCHNRKCCNPDHLEVGTMLENMGDCVKAGRQARGEGSGQSKLNEKQVLEILEERTKNKTNYKEIAEKYDVSKSCINSIILRRTWKHI